MLGQMISGSPQYMGNMNPPANQWQGNQMSIPNYEAIMQMMQQQNAQQPQIGPAPAPLQAQDPKKKKQGGFEGFLQTGGLGLLPMLASGGDIGDFKGIGLGNVIGGLFR
jgi:hypothetical protein